QRGSQLTPADLDVLEDMLEDAAGDGAAADQVDRGIGEAASSSGGLGLFIRSLVGLDRAAVRERFAEFLDQSTYNVTQIRYVETIIDELTVNGVVEPGRLFEDPYTEIIADPLDPASGFEFGELTVIRTILTDLRDAAAPVGA
ncbi:MAG: restriction endonuclease subunit R, partial [Corynebacterium variabile]|nr:restriction endonuclease subunit R [Corynebacterium variabile]